MEAIDSLLTPRIEFLVENQDESPAPNYYYNNSIKSEYCKKENLIINEG